MYFLEFLQKYSIIVIDSDIKFILYRYVMKSYKKIDFFKRAWCFRLEGCKYVIYSWILCLTCHEIKVSTKEWEENEET